MSTIKINELATKALYGTDFFINGDINGVAYKNTITELSNFINITGSVTFRGNIAIADTPALDGWYFAEESGIYTNAGGLVVDLLNQLTIIIIEGSVTIFSQTIIPISTTLLTTFDKTNNTQAATMKATDTYIESLNKEFLGAEDITIGGESTNVGIILSNGYQSNDGILEEFNIYSNSVGEIALKVFNKNDLLVDYQFLTVAVGQNTFKVKDSTLNEMSIIAGDAISIDVPSSVNIKYDSASVGNSYLYYITSSGKTWESVSWNITLSGQISMNTIVNNTNGSQEKAIKNRSEDILSQVGYQNEAPVASTGVTISLINSNNINEGIVDTLTVDVVAVNSGELQIQLLTYNFETASFDVTSTEDVVVSSVGSNTIKLSSQLSINKKNYIALQTIAGGCTIGYDTSSGEGYYYNVGTVTGSDNNFSFTQGGKIFSSIVLKQVVDTTAETSNITTTLEDVENFDSLPTDWVNTGLFSFNSNVATSTTTGVSNVLGTNNAHGIDNRVIRWEFSMSSVGIIGFNTIPKESGINAGSLIRVDAINGQLQIMDNYASSSVKDFIPLGFSIVTDRVYVIEITKNGRNITVDLYDKEGYNFISINRTSNTNYQTYPIFNGYDQGALQGAPSVCALTGVVKVYSFNHYALAKTDCKLMIFGDSITEGWLNTDAEKYTRLLQNTIGFSDVVVSGIGGAVTAGVLKRLESEFLIFKPKYTLVYIGSNTDSSFNKNISIIVNTILKNNSIPVVCTIPTQITETSFVNSMPDYVNKVKFDLALSSTGAGSSLVTKFYTNTDLDGTPYTDPIHPNAEGGINMIRRIKIDVPNIFK